ncbi:MAG TPA: hypothetical protein DDW76_09110 [Cyanobacteria bacterium UBA11369]|nr:hypothetical protein [Cyanobacteria bacterium UBA11371]HBE34360.1 hypothetical protein [Cyanobacteria bacterium UBA11368]HBE48939.1 hypothetical protein [Cyanobacteria bacterium UBA11369]
MFYSKGKASSALLWAAYYGSGDIAELLIASGASVHVADDRGYTPLHIASKEGHKDVVELLIAHGAQINASAEDGCTPLYMAASGQHRDIAQIFLDYDAIMEPDIAVMLGEIELVRHYLEQGIDVNSKLTKGLTKGESWLITAISNKNKNLVTLLVNCGARVNERMESKNVCPLHRASAIGCRDICEFLIARGADVNAEGQYGKTPLHLATQFGHLNTVELLLECGANINALDTEGRSALFAAAQRNRPQIMELLLSRGAEVNLTDKLGYTPLCLAFQQSGGDEIVRIVVAYGADINVRDAQGFSSLHRAVIQKNKKMVELLLAYGATEGLE